MTDTSKSDYSQNRTEKKTSHSFTRRRRFLQTAAASMAIGLAGCSGNSGSGGSGDSDKIPKSEVNYQDHPESGNQCSNCIFYVASPYDDDTGKCSQVSGKIAADGWCNIYTEG